MLVQVFLRLEASFVGVGVGVGVGFGGVLVVFPSPTRL